MNILAINNFSIIPQQKKTSNKQDFQYRSTFGLTMAKPLSKDTVSFGQNLPTVKKLASFSRDAGIPMRDAITAYKEASKIQPDIQEYFIRLFKPITATKEDPKLPIDEVRGRAKGALSIWEKSRTRGWKTLDDVFINMTDLNGAKIVLRDSSNKGVQMVLDYLYKGIDAFSVILTEVEVKRPKAAQDLPKKERGKYDYGTWDMLKNFVKDSEKSMGKKVNFPEPCLTESNYPAIHMLLKFPGQRRSVELQIMGYDVSIDKAMDDLFFKILNNKKVEDEFLPIKFLINVLQEEKNAEYLEKMNKYRGESFLFQREKEPMFNENRGEEYFLPLRYNIPYQEILPEKFYKKLVEDYGIVGNPYDFNNLYKIYKVCRAKADIAREKLLEEKASKKAKKTK